MSVKLFGQKNGCDVVRTLLKDGGPVDLDDCLVGIFILLAVIHGDDAQSSKPRIGSQAHKLLQCCW